jgi:ABC-type glycerol-3-phosphate transport system substrate-binding protein
MKRFVLMALLVVVALASCAPRVVEKQVPVQVKPTKLRWLAEVDPVKAAWLAQEYRKFTDGKVDVEFVFTQAPDGTTSEIQAMFASGQPPDVYSAYGGRVSQYYDIAVPLDLDEDKYIPGLLDMCKNSKGEVVAAPVDYWVQTGSLSNPLIKKYGLEQYVPKGDRAWTLAEFNQLVDAFAAKKAPDEYAVFFYAASGSGDYWMQMFERGFGANPLYNADGKLDVNNPEMKAAWQWMKDMVARGLAPAGPEGLSDDHFVAMRAENKLLFSGGGFGEQDATLVSYPSVDGSFVPLAVAPTSHIAISGNGKDTEAKAFVEWLSTPERTAILWLGQWVPRTDMDSSPPKNEDDAYKHLSAEQFAVTLDGWNFLQASLKKYGTMNIGVGSTHYQAIRTLRAQKLAEAFAGKDVAVALAEFQAEGEAILK